jgi:hypothetical protein
MQATKKIRLTIVVTVPTLIDVRLETATLKELKLLTPTLATIVKLIPNALIK